MVGRVAYAKSSDPATPQNLERAPSYKILYVLGTLRNNFTFWSVLSASQLILIAAQVPVPSCWILSIRFLPQFWKTGLPPHDQQTTCLVFLSDFLKLYTMIILIKGNC